MEVKQSSQCAVSSFNDYVFGPIDPFAALPSACSSVSALDDDLICDKDYVLPYPTYPLPTGQRTTGEHAGCKLCSYFSTVFGITLARWMRCFRNYVFRVCAFTCRVLFQSFFASK
jgi:hypothetical protein